MEPDLGTGVDGKRSQSLSNPECLIFAIHPPKNEMVQSGGRQPNAPFRNAKGEIEILMTW